MHSKPSTGFSGYVAIFFTTAFILSCATSNKSNPSDISTKNSNLVNGTSLLTNSRQMTFDGRRAGEGYFSPDGKLMIFQSEREETNPFYQMYVKNLETGKTNRVSPGYGKTTCGWIFPDKKHVTYSSTHLDKNSLAKQKSEIDFRNSGQQKRYSWDYDENYEIFKAGIDGKNPINLTKTLGYDAESSISPDGTQIVFASNRSAYNIELSDDLKKKLELDPSYFMDIYIMNSDGSNVRRLTNVYGYDGGPFFSPDGQRIVWRRFSPDGHSAEVFTMKTDGTDLKQITTLKAMSWAPFYHPSGDYIVFTTNLQGYQNFELYIVDSEGKNNPIRITDLEGFDGLPVFTPDGTKLTWNRKVNSTDSQIMIADWNDDGARKLLGLPAAPPSVKVMTSDITEKDLKKIISYLASAELQGRDTGSPGERQAMQTISKYFEDLNLSPAVDNSFTQKFEFTKEALLGSRNELTSVSNQQKTLQLNSDWRPLAFSKPGEVAASSIVIAGYGIRAPADRTMPAYDSFANLDLKDKWVMVFRYVPEKVTAERRLYLQRYAKLEYKAIVARDLGARGIIFVSGPNSNVKEELINFQRLAGVDMGIPALSISDKVAENILKESQKNLKTLQNDLDQEKVVNGFELTQTKFSAVIDIRSQKSEGQNALAILRVPGAKRTLIIGAHGDHLGLGHSDSSLMNKNDKDPIHYGADDNASGVSAVLELAHRFATMKKNNPTLLKQNILFAVWSGEELGNLGSSYFVKSLKKSKILPSAYINMDMIGRWKNLPQSQQLEPLLIQGIGSSDQWKELVEAAKFEFPIQLQNDPYLPTDAMALYLGKIPAINFFTGVHTDYHTPRDTEDKINYSGLKTIAEAVFSIAQQIAEKDISPVYKQAPASSMELKRSFRIYLGTIPDYSNDGIKGVRLSGVVNGGPADKAGLKSGDIIVELSSRKIENIHDYVYSLESIRPNESTQVVVVRNGKRETIRIVPLAKE